MATNSEATSGERLTESIQKTCETDKDTLDYLNYFLGTLIGYIPADRLEKSIRYTEGFMYSDNAYLNTFWNAED